MAESSASCQELLDRLEARHTELLERLEVLDQRVQKALDETGCGDQVRRPSA